WTGSTRNTTCEVGRGAIGATLALFCQTRGFVRHPRRRMAAIYGAKSRYYREPGRKASRRSAACRRHVADSDFGCESRLELLLDRRRCTWGIGDTTPS